MLPRCCNQVTEHMPAEQTEDAIPIVEAYWQQIRGCSLSVLWHMMTPFVGDQLQILVTHTQAFVAVTLWSGKLQILDQLLPGWRPRASPPRFSSPCISH